jgi:hypothetical protein
MKKKDLKGLVKVKNCLDISGLNTGINTYALFRKSIQYWLEINNIDISINLPLYQYKGKFLINGFDLETEDNAYFSPEGCLVMGYLNYKKKKIPLAFSADVIVHETGHAILHSITNGDDPAQNCELFFSSFHECFGDVNSIIFACKHEEVAKFALGYDKTAKKFLNPDLEEDNCISDLAEQFGQKLGEHALRCSSQIYTFEEAQPECHDLSRVLSGLYYQLIREIFISLKNNSTSSLEIVLSNVADILLKILDFSVKVIFALKGKYTSDIKENYINFWNFLNFIIIFIFYMSNSFLSYNTK